MTAIKVLIDRNKDQQQQEDDIEEAAADARWVLAHDDSSFFVTSSTNPGTTTGCIRFRPFLPRDREIVQCLHEEWFPVRYKQEFYDELVYERMFNSGDELFTCAAIYHHHDEVDEHSSDDDDRLSSTSDCSMEKYNGCIVACIVGSFVHVSRLDASTVNMLISDTSRYSRLFYIMTLGTVMEFRNIRLATTLVQDVIRMVEDDATCGALYLHVITFNDAAIRFYERLGFYRVTEIENYYKIDGKLYNCYLYARYCHGNRGHWDVYHVMGRLLASIWRRVRYPLASILPFSSSSPSQQQQQQLSK